MLEEQELVEEEPIVEYDYEIGLDNLYKYNIVALNDADINQHIRGSIWVGGVILLFRKQKISVQF